jgi:hypothetical protein
MGGGSDGICVFSAAGSAGGDELEGFMARLIDADALGIGKANPGAFEKPEYAHGWNSAIDIIRNAPTVDAVEVVHGRGYQSITHTTIEMVRPK